MLGYWKSLFYLQLILRNIFKFFKTKNKTNETKKKKNKNKKQKQKLYKSPSLDIVVEHWVSFVCMFVIAVLFHIPPLALDKPSEIAKELQVKIPKKLKKKKQSKQWHLFVCAAFRN